MVRMSFRSGTSWMVHSLSVSRVAARMGSAAFLAPEIGTVPRSGTPPSTTMESMASGSYSF